MNLSKSLEDYLECIYLIMLEHDVVRLKTVAKEMKVSAPSALGAVNNLKKEGLVRHKKYYNIELTEKGEEFAKEIFLKHAVIYRFLNEILGLDSEKADKEACQLEHHLSDETTDRFVKFVRYLKSCPQCQSRGFKSFHKYYNDTLADQNKTKQSTKTDSLSNFDIGSFGVIKKITGAPEIRKQIIAKGILPKTEVQLIDISKDEATLKFQEFNINLSAFLCEYIIVEKII
ncbi:MAG: hypothetical protein C0601_00185 [Candidatus Muiribacterium halophilum]|uniref:HTH dtxR-type domain-containing protein n=1 Tax=Muiribacterium halophilum TaxID=2053465 RepID=A0A2N5ZN33_MUIH1|nr:MAG: hypothetical protein C0601_00185 [Candidatus Muirbacterium halophilum]